MTGERQSETGQDLWSVLLAPTVWACHFLASYVFAAVYCEKAGRMSSILPAAVAVTVFTIAALAAIAFIAFRTWQVHGLSATGGDRVYEVDTPEERHRFLAHVTLMLCALSAVAVLYETLPALMIGTCR